MSPLITLVLTIVGVLLKVWADNRPTKEEKRYAEIQKGRAAIANGDVDDIESRLDVVLTQASSSAGGKPGEEDLTKRAESLLGVPSNPGSTGNPT